MIYGGLSWNRLSVVDMLGSDLSELPLLQKVACWIIFYSQWHLCSDEIRTFLEAVTTSGMQSSHSDLSSSSSNNLTQLVTPGASSSTFISTPADFAYTESILIGLIRSDITVCEFSVTSKQDTAYYLKLIRRLQTNAKWKMNSNAPKSFFDFVTGNTGKATNVPSLLNQSRLLTMQERQLFDHASLDEYYNVLNMISILGRAIIMAYNSLEKSQKPIPPSIAIKDLMDVLPPGMKSDIANACLECLEHATSIWKKRLCCQSFNKIEFNQSCAISTNKKSHKVSDVLAYIRNKYRGDCMLPSLPMLGIFYAICENLPISSTAQTALNRMIQEFHDNSSNLKK